MSLNFPDYSELKRLKLIVTGDYVVRRMYNLPNTPLSNNLGERTRSSWHSCINDVREQIGDTLADMLDAKAERVKIDEVF